MTQNLQKELSDLQKPPGFATCLLKHTQSEDRRRGHKKFSVFVVSGSAAKTLAGFLRVTRAPTKMRQLITAVEEALEPLVYVNYLVGVEGFTSVRAMDQCSVEHKRCFTLLYPENSASLKHALENKNRLC